MTWVFSHAGGSGGSQTDKPLKINEDEIAEARWCTPDEALQLIRKGTTAEFFLINAVKELKRKI